MAIGKKTARKPQHRKSAKTKAERTRKSWRVAAYKRGGSRPQKGGKNKKPKGLASFQNQTVGQSKGPPTEKNDARGARLQREGNEKDMERVSGEG